MIEIIKIHDRDYGDFHALAHKGKLIPEVNRFLIWKKDHGGRRGNQKLSTGSQRQYAYHMKYLLDTIMESSTPKKWFELTIEDLKSISEQMDQGEDGLDRGVINIRTQLWAEFFFWCRKNGYDHNMHIKTIKVETQNYTDDDFLAHTEKDNYIGRTELWLPPIDKSRIFRVISHSTWIKLKEELYKIDPVYEAVAIVMISTGLRINGALQLNKTSFLPYPDLNPQEELDFLYIPKGQMDSKRKISCVFPIDTWGWLHGNIMTERKKRAKLYKKRFRKPTQKLFLKKTGMPVQDFDVWKAFDKVSKIIGIKITPHMLRHTFATWTVMVWAEQEGVRPTTESFYKSIHDMLSDQLGHKHISTTKKYCRTASMHGFKKLMPKVSKIALNKPHIKRSFNTLTSLGFDVGL